jgi:hypothetical protein
MVGSDSGYQSVVGVDRSPGALARARLRQQATVLRPGGLVVPIEVNVSTMRWLPETPFATQVRSWLVEAFAKAGISTLGLLTKAHRPDVRAAGPVGSGTRLSLLTEW